MTSILQVALGIGLLIFIHELGHYLAARAAGVRVEVFSLGFGTRVLGFVRRGTDYRLSLIPLGGYVKVAGEDPMSVVAPAPDDLHAKGFAARGLFYAGGVIMNLLFALIAFPLIFKSGVEFTAPVIGSVVPGGAAWRAGLQPGDRILAVDGKQMYSFENLRVEHALAAGRPVENLVERDGETFGVMVESLYDEGLGLYDLGARPSLAPMPLRILDVEPDGPADAPGVRSEDRIVAIDGVRVVGRDAHDALLDLADAAPGRTVTLTVARDGVESELSLTTGSRQVEVLRIGVSPASRQVQATRDRLPLDIRAGDVVLSVDGRPFAQASDWSTVREGETELTVEVRRDGKSLTLTAAVSAEDREAVADGVAFTYSSDPSDGVHVAPLARGAAEAAGILPGDQVVAVDGEPVAVWDDLREAIRAAGESPVRLTVRRGEATLVETIAPRRDMVADLGFDYELERLQQLYRKDTFGEAIEAGMVASVDLIKQLYVTLKGLFTGDIAAKNLGGIVTISRASYHYAETGFAEFLYFLALLSINLAFINVLPIPVLDGGHLMFLLIEKVKGSPVSTRVLNYSQLLGLVFVIALMVFVTYNDIRRLF